MKTDLPSVDRRLMPKIRRFELWYANSGLVGRICGRNGKCVRDKRTCFLVNVLILDDDVVQSERVGDI